MRVTRRVDVFVRRLEDSIDSMVRNRGRVVLAYSAGLASMLVGMVARKRCELRCLVAGVDGSPDVEAAKMAGDLFDYDVGIVRLGAPEALRILESVTAQHPELRGTEHAMLVPVCAVLNAANGATRLAGFGSPRIRAGIIAFLDRTGVGIPLGDIARGRMLPRSELRATALALGLPAAWAHARHRAPTVGAGIDGFFRDRRLRQARRVVRMSDAHD